MAKNYTAYGLVIQSELELNELNLVKADKPDVVISLGEVPTALEDVKLKLLKVAASKDQLLLNIDGVVRILVSHGSQIILDIDPAADNEDVKAFLYSTAMTSLLQQRGIWMLHASVIDTGGQAVLFIGHSGDGKSTLAAQFKQRGYTVLSDDIAAMQLDRHGNIVVLPGIPRIKLWQDALDQAGLSSEGLLPVRNRLQKYALPITSDAKPIPVKALYVIRHLKTPDIVLAPVKGDRQFLMLKNQTHKPQLYQAQGDLKQRFLCSIQLVKQAKMQFIKHCHKVEQMPELLDTLENDFKRV